MVRWEMGFDILAKFTESNGGAGKENDIGIFQRYCDISCYFDGGGGGGRRGGSLCFLERFQVNVRVRCALEQGWPYAVNDRYGE